MQHIEANCGDIKSTYLTKGGGFQDVVTKDSIRSQAFNKQQRKGQTQKNIFVFLN